MINKSFIDYLKTRKFWLITKFKFLLCNDDEKYVKKQFRKHHQYELDLKNPRHIDEKFSINKFRDNSLIKKKLSDKVTVREYVKEKGLDRILIQPFEYYNKVSDINFNEIKEPVIIKCSNTSGLAYKYFPGNKIDRWKLRTLSYLQKQNYYIQGREKNYDNLDGKIIVEKMLIPNNKVLFDYKFFCFDGEIGFVFIEQGISDESGCHDKYFKRNIVDENYNEINGASETRISSDLKTLEKPKNWDDMVQCAKILSRDFNFVRIDLFSVDDVTYFGETTFYHRAGNANYQPEAFDLEFAKKIRVIEK